MLVEYLQTLIAHTNLLKYGEMLRFLQLLKREYRKEENFVNAIIEYEAY
jgi:hypothetical protein